MTSITIRKHAQGYTLRNGDNHVFAACSTLEEALASAANLLADPLPLAEPPSDTAMCACAAGHEYSCRSSVCPRRTSPIVPRYDAAAYARGDMPPPAPQAHGRHS